MELSKVLNTLKREVDSIYELSIGNQVAFVTAEHPFYISKKGWITVKELKAGYKVLTSAGRYKEIKSLRLLGNKVTVYNIEVDGNHNYFVTGIKILVHNKKNIR